MNLPRAALLLTILLASVPAIAQHGPSTPAQSQPLGPPAARSASSRWMPAGSAAASRFRSRPARRR